LGVFKELRDNFPPRGGIRRSAGAQRLQLDPASSVSRRDGAPAPEEPCRLCAATDRAENHGLPSHAHRSNKLTIRNYTMTLFLLFRNNKAACLW